MGGRSAKMSAKHAIPSPLGRQALAALLLGAICCQLSAVEAMGELDEAPMMSPQTTTLLELKFEDGAALSEVQHLGDHAVSQRVLAEVNAVSARHRRRAPRQSLHP